MEIILDIFLRIRLGVPLVAPSNFPYLPIGKSAPDRNKHMYIMFFFHNCFNTYQIKCFDDFLFSSIFLYIEGGAWWAKHSDQPSVEAHKVIFKPLLGIYKYYYYILDLCEGTLQWK